jgi:thimet oligopeptidase
MGRVARGTQWHLSARCSGSDRCSQARCKRRCRRAATVERRLDLDQQCCRAGLADVLGAPRILAEQLEVEIQRFHNDLLLDREVFDQLSAIDQGHLDPPALRVRSLAVRSFRRAGVDLDEPTREEIRELNDRETVLSQAFSRNIRDGRRTALVPAAALAGFPADFVESHPADADGLVAITTEHPDVHAFLTYCRDPDARRALALEFFNLAWPQNDAVLGDLLRLRRDKAQLLGYSDWPDFDAEVKMIGNGQAIGEFIDSVAADSLAAGQRDLAILAKRGAEDGIEVIDLSSWRYCFEAVKREQYGVDAQEVRRYFAFPKVHQGLLEVTGRLFGLRYEPVQVATWHADVTSYDVYLAGADGTENLLGRIHLDLHPREHKYNHAAQFTLVPGVDGSQRGGHPLPRVRSPDAPHVGRSARVGPLLRGGY